MIVKKILNNNVITSISDTGQEIIIVGNGIGWKQKSGQQVDETKIDKIFRMDTASTTARLKQLFLEVRVESIKASSEIIEYAKEHLGKELKKNIYITLTDHLDFAVERFQKGLNFKNALYWEIRKIYRREFEIGQYALKIVQRYLGIELPEDEAAAIAIHLVNAEYDGNMANTESMVRIVNNSLQMVKIFTGKQFDEESLDYQRFVTHLLFFAQRIIEGKLLPEKDSILYEAIRKEHPGELKCARKISELIQREYEVKVGQEEITFLAVHIARIIGTK